MATVSRFPVVLSLSTDRMIFYGKKQLELNWTSSTCGYSCPQQSRFAICASSVSRPRASRKVKSNEELCSEIREFISVVGLPESHVPTMKELSEHGRNDLANIVRRRGYKLIRELLASSAKADIDEFNVEKNADEKQNAVRDREDILTGQDGIVNNVVEDESLLSEVSSMENCTLTVDDGTCFNSNDDKCVKENVLSTLTSQNGEVENVAEDDSLLTEISSMRNSCPISDTGTYVNSDDYSCTKENAVSTLNNQNEEVNSDIGDVSLSTGVPIMGSLNANSDSNSNEHGCMPVESSSAFSFEENTAYIIKGLNEKTNYTGENVFSSTSSSTVETYFNSPFDCQFVKPDDNTCMDEESSVTSNLEEKAANFIQNGNLDLIEDNVYGTLNESGAGERRESTDTQEAVETQLRTNNEEHCEHNYSNGTSDGVASNGSNLALKDVTSATVNRPRRKDHPKAGDAELNKDSNVETIRKEEINHLKYLLHEKELELTQLKEQIEKEKHALSLLQTEAETEINKAQKLILEKDAELHVAEESLSGLEEVEIQYCGDGEIVEVAGSFNGWHHRIKMDPQPSSTVEPTDARISKRWSTMLWLYPGMYEIKFIVDGQWRTDPQRESVTRGYLTNNILRVDR